MGKEYNKELRLTIVNENQEINGQFSLNNTS